MLNAIWVGMLVTGIVIGCANGRFGEIESALLESGGNAITFAIGILGITAFWCGLLEILREAGVIQFFGKIFRPIVFRLFPETKKNREAETQIITNLTANFFGLGNGATPSGIAAVKELQKGRNPSCAGKSVCLFLVINSAALQLIPTTVIAVRAAAGSTEASRIIVPTWIASLVSLFIGIGVFLFLELLKPNGKERKK